MAKKYSYAEIEKELPLIVKASLQKENDLQRQLFAEEYSKKRRKLSTAYLCALVLVSTHRWYLGRPGTTVLQWASVLVLVGVVWIVADWFRLPAMCRERNEEIAKTVLAEQRILSGV